MIMLSHMASSCPLTITHSRMFSTTSSKILLVSQRLPSAEHRITGLISLSMELLCTTTFNPDDALKSGLLALKGCSILAIYLGTVSVKKRCRSDKWEILAKWRFSLHTLL